MQEIQFNQPSYYGVSQLKAAEPTQALKITSLSIAIILGFGALFGAAVALTSSLPIGAILAGVGVLGGIIAIICIFKAKIFNPEAIIHSLHPSEEPVKSSRHPSQKSVKPISPVKGKIEGIRLAHIHKFKLISEAQKKFHCRIIYKNGNDSYHCFNSPVYNAFLKVLPESRKEIF